MYGWMGKIIRIDLSTGTVRDEPLNEELRHYFVGGRGINSRMLYDATDSTTSPFSPDNVLIFGTSPLSGTTAPSTPRCTVSAKSPLTGILGDANFGGFFGPALKACGFDHVVVTGKAETPVLIRIDNELLVIDPHLPVNTVPARRDRWPYSDAVRPDANGCWHRLSVIVRGLNRRSSRRKRRPAPWRRCRAPRRCRRSARARPGTRARPTAAAA